ncbi:hypothetical protein PUNSTDRAFT_133189 [Punctularia strigosozonata HHB-11173 SS5]|uniref:uncharacterized protein n=1 Tax=Punctularia strigosozonata (strain HHB-11173) TaxID=741275 RepID=UPI000441683C|nr:uncharacterized protein PUNSTDRAFT_133189 [Punctularia strigosozonata HHB-11173 SS5]EIN09395.1 hypothetical protein PUNSTDRAFT_133189 [Punctularia strigosozonata HHB-11173 SS5]
MLLTPAYSLVTNLPITWSTTQARVMRTDYPFSEIGHEDIGQYVIRTYLQYLWLPESLMPLRSIIPSLLRVVPEIPSTSYHQPHPLHELLEPLLMSTRDAALKYQQELPQILAEGGGAGEVEETMMWYVFAYEKMGDSSKTREPGVTDPASCKDWLERLERREVQLQILLYMLKLSLPGPFPTITKAQASTETRMKKRKQTNEVFEQNEIASLLEGRLESFMDKLSVWQLVASMTSEKNHVPESAGQDRPRDWQQMFAEDVVDPLFGRHLPHLCALLRSKVYSHSPFVDDEPDSIIDDGDSPSAANSGQTPLDEQQHWTSSRQTSPNPTKRDAPPRNDRLPLRSSRLSGASSTTRSRSLSVTLAQDRAASTGPPEKKRAFSREVSMTRVFKDKDKRSASRHADKAVTEPRSSTGARKEQFAGTTLVATTPVKKHKSR